MRKLIILSALLGLALAHPALAAPDKANKKKAQPVKAAAAARPRGHSGAAPGRAMTASRGGAPARVHAQRQAVAPHQQQAVARRNGRADRIRSGNVNAPARGRGNNRVAAERARQSQAIVTQPAVNAKRVHRTTAAQITNHWRGDRFRGQNYAAFRNYHREVRNRDWYRRNNTRITFYSGAPYYWNAGYWYPAWGYNPGYVYQYDGPIYGYNGLPPDQVLVTVQRRLQAEGYYEGGIDGSMGPLTRQALADYQADHRLPVTAAVDQPTLATLGLT